MKLSNLLLLIPSCGLFALPLIAQDQIQTSPISTPVLSGPLQIQDTPAPPPPTASPDPAVTSPVAPTDTNTTVQTAPAPVDTNNFTPGSNDPVAPAPNSGLGSPGQNPPPSDPNSLIPPPQEIQPSSPINSAGNEEKQRQDQKAHYYSVKVKADKEEDLSSLLVAADKAKSDESKRQALREYYDLLAKRMKKIDSSLSDWIDTMHAAYLRRLDQVRVEPTIPMNLPPVPSSEVASSSDSVASPTPSHRKKKKATPPPEPSPVKKSKKAAGNE